MFCAISDYSALRATALDLFPMLEVVHLFAPSGEGHVEFRDPAPEYVV